MSLKAVRRAFADSANLVVHFYGVAPIAVVDADSRADLWSRVVLILRGDDPNAHAAVKVFRFRDDSGASLIAVEESC